MKSHLVVPANAANGTAGGRTEDGRVGGRRAFAAHRVVTGRAGAGRSVAVRAQIARLAAEDRSGAAAVLVAGVFRLGLGRRCRVDVDELGVMARITLALGVVSYVALASDSAVFRARPARSARRMAARRVAESGSGQTRLALGVLQDRVVVCPDANFDHARAGWALGAGGRR